MASVLIVDTESAPSAELCARLRQQGHVTTRVETIAAALRFFDSAEADVVLLNGLRLGDRAFQAMEVLRRHPRASRVRMELYPAKDEEYECSAPVILPVVQVRLRVD